MDTSIIVVIAIIVVFAVAVPAIIRKSATELARIEIDTIPDGAKAISAVSANPGHTDTERTKVFHAKPAKVPHIPTPEIARYGSAPSLKLSAPVPEFSVIDGEAEETAIPAEVDAESQLDSMPVAVGETHSALAVERTGGPAHAGGLATPGNGVVGGSGTAPGGTSSAGNVRLLHPAVQAVFNQSSEGAGTRPGPSQSGPSQSGPLQAGPLQKTPGQGRQPRRESERGNSLGAGTSKSQRNLQTSNPRVGADEEQSMTEQARTLHESMKSLGTIVRGFALLFLGSVLGILVTSVLAIFSVVHIALAGVFLGLAVVALAIVRTLNLRKAKMKKRLARLETAPRPRTTKKSTTEAESATTAKGAAHRQAAPRTHAAPVAVTSSGTAARIASAAQGAAGSKKAVQARAAMRRGVSAKVAREEADTGEIPLVKIRKEATVGHSTRQVLLTGPVPVVKDETAEADVESTTESEAVAKTRAPSKESVGGTSRALGSDLMTESHAGIESTDSGPVTAAAEVRAALDAAAPTVDDPFMQRLKSRDGWSPTPLPVPSYVDAPQAEHRVPRATSADASSYETEARSREDVAAQFAAELGYRPELSDSAREDSPLEHGRKATRTTQAADLGAVNDVLARRRA